MRTRNHAGIIWWRSLEVPWRRGCVPVMPIVSRAILEPRWGELTMDLRVGLLDLLRLAYREEQTFVEILSEKERAVIETYDQWSVKDVIAHVATWKERTAQELAA
jgi:hypothetical protein